MSEAVQHCQLNNIPLTIVAQLTSTTGASVAFGGWILSTELLVEVSTGSYGAGLILGELQDQLLSEGKMFPPDPTSRYECSLGGAISCNASGARSFKYGPIRNWIEWVEAVLPTGVIVEATRETAIPSEWPKLSWEMPDVKSAAGYFPTSNLLDLLIGHEGTLAVITKARLKTISPVPRVTTIVAFMESLDTVLALVELVRGDNGENDLRPCAIEYFDKYSLELVREMVPDVPKVAKHALLIDVEYTGDDPPLEQWWDCLVEVGALADDTIVADDDKSREKLRKVRHAVPAGINELVVQNGMPKVGTDLAVPNSGLRPIMELYEACPFRYVLFGHIGDNHLHLNLLPTNEEELALAKEWYRALAQKAVAMGGTVSAEHGIGKVKRELLAQMVGQDTLESFEAMKKVVDPNLILGRGNLF